ncbi:hypothetical protein F5880DRAFT_506982 [Lentinula raphanica]|nr:hypothetical protein F5880DRAFT_506982 [Lentinula raphanica]
MVLLGPLWILSGKKALPALISLLLCLSKFPLIPALLSGELHPEKVSLTEFQSFQFPSTSRHSKSMASHVAVFSSHFILRGQSLFTNHKVLLSQRQKSVWV